MWKRLMSGRWRAAWAGLTAVIVLSLFVFYPPLRTAASEFLGIFRVRKFTAIPVNLSALENPTFANVLESAFSDQVKFVRQPGPTTTVGSVHEASQLVGFDVRLPAHLPATYTTAPSLQVQDGAAFQLTVDVEYVKAVRDLLGMTDVPIPANLDGAQVDVDVPRVVMAWYRSERGALSIAQAVSPEIELPPNVDLAQLGEFGLRLAGMPETQARQMASVIDWANTLIIPVPADYATYQEVTVAGSRGLLIGANPDQGAAHWLLALEKDGIVYGIEGSLAADEILAIAESMF